MTFTQILEKQYGNEHSFHLRGRQKFDDMEVYRKLSRNEKRDINFISGHLSWLLEKDIPLEVRYVTFIREPISQFVSSYNYIMQTEHNVHHEAVKKLGGIENFLDWQIRKEHDSVQTRYLGDAVKYHARELGYRVSMQDNDQGNIVYEKAKKRLNNIEFTFITKEFDEALLILKNKLKWKKNPYYRRINTSEHREKPGEQLIKSIREVHKYDFKIYEEAKRRHEKAKQVAGENFNLQLKAFQAANSIRTKLASLKNS